METRWLQGRSLEMSIKQVIFELSGPHDAVIAGFLNKYKRFPVCADDEEDSENGDDLREPLIAGLGSDDEGSVGSEDSSCDEDELLPPPISMLLSFV